MFNQIVSVSIWKQLHFVYTSISKLLERFRLEFWMKINGFIQTIISTIIYIL